MAEDVRPGISSPVRRLLMQRHRLLAEPASDANSTAFEIVDRYFLALRIGSALAATAWAGFLAVPDASLRAGLLAAGFVLYSLVLYVYVWTHPRRRPIAYLAVLPVDLVFLFLLCLWSSEPMSGVYLAFYLVIALHAFYFGTTVGVLAAVGFAVLYSCLYAVLPAATRVPAEELFLRLSFGFLVAGSFGLIAHQLWMNRRELSLANRQLQQRNRVLEQTYRCLSIGRLAGDVAHQINNPAAAIVAKVELLRRRVERDGSSEAYLRDLTAIAEHAFRISRVTHSLVALAPASETRPASLELSGLAEGVTLLFERRAADHGVQIERKLAPGLRVYVAEAALRQVLLNLLCNALDAVGQGGTVRITTRPATDPTMVEICVQDDGPGIPPERVEDVFSPFFTTKRDGVGVGLGLSQSLALVGRMRGTISVESTMGQGTSFIVTLPASPTPEQAEGAAAAAPVRELVPAGSFGSS